MTQTCVKINNGVNYETTNNINIQVNLWNEKDVDLIADLICKLDAWNLKVNPTFKYVDTINIFWQNDKLL